MFANREQRGLRTQESKKNSFFCFDFRGSAALQLRPEDDREQLHPEADGQA